MSVTELVPVVRSWIDQNLELAADPAITYIQVFENRGEMMGASNPHPHGQIWASASIPNEIAKETASQQEYRADRNSCLLCDYVTAEREGERLVASNAGFLALVPFWAVWPFEVMIIPARHMQGLTDLTSTEQEQLADILRKVTTAYDALFDVPFPYTMGFHQSPCHTNGNEWHLHAHFYPPLLRSPTIRKFMVGYELLASPQRDLTPEAAAARLRDRS